MTELNTRNILLYNQTMEIFTKAFQILKSSYWNRHFQHSVKPHSTSMYLPWSWTRGNALDLGIKMFSFTLDTLQEFQNLSTFSSWFEHPWTRTGPKIEPNLAFGPLFANSARTGPSVQFTVQHIRVKNRTELNFDITTTQAPSLPTPAWPTSFSQ